MLHNTLKESVRYSGKPLIEVSNKMNGTRLSRRDVLSRMWRRRGPGLGVGIPSALAAAGNPAGSFLLSRQGCGRATGYSESNKVVTWRRRTHIAWLDSPPEGFRVRVRSYDRGPGEWSPTVTAGHAHDNHGGPALTVDSEGLLHIVYYPHPPRHVLPPVAPARGLLRVGGGGPIRRAPDLSDAGLRARRPRCSSAPGAATRIVPGRWSCGSGRHAGSGGGAAPS